MMRAIRRWLEGLVVNPQDQVWAALGRHRAALDRLEAKEARKNAP